MRESLTLFTYSISIATRYSYTYKYLNVQPIGFRWLLTIIFFGIFCSQMRIYVIKLMDVPIITTREGWKMLIPRVVNISRLEAIWEAKLYFWPQE